MSKRRPVFSSPGDLASKIATAKAKQEADDRSWHWMEGPWMYFERLLSAEEQEVAAEALIDDRDRIAQEKFGPNTIALPVDARDCQVQWSTAGEGVFKKAVARLRWRVYTDGGVIQGAAASFLNAKSKWDFAFDSTKPVEMAWDYVDVTHFGDPNQVFLVGRPEKVKRKKKGA